jgi:hypothetical protein
MFIGAARCECRKLDGWNEHRAVMLGDSIEPFNAERLLKTSRSEAFKN